MSIPNAPSFVSFSFVLLAVALTATPAPTQETLPQQGPRLAVQDPVQRAAMLVLTEEIQEIRAQLQQAREGLPTAADRTAELERIGELQARLRSTEWRFDSLVVGMDVKEFDVPAQKDFDLQQEFTKLVQPLVQNLTEFTAVPREVTDLENRIKAIDEIRLSAARAARARVGRELDALLETGEETDSLRSQLGQIQQGWDNRIRALEQQLAVLSAELANRKAARRSVVDVVMSETQYFFQKRGVSLLLAVLTFLTVFLGFRFVQRRVSRVGRQRSSRAFSLRLADVLLHVLAITAAIGATLVVLYVVNDFLLLTIALLFLLGAGWAAMKMLPQFFEQFRLMLNLGAVREGERLVIDGLPWRVESLKFYSMLSNPALQGGHLRIPIRDLMSLRSRRMAEDEPWFPCRVGDWVLLEDGTRGRVKVQTPETVVLQHFGGEKSYPTTAFLDENPRNLSSGFLVDVVFGVDYSHQVEATTEIPSVFRAALQAALPKLFPAGGIKNVIVEFREAGASSLDSLVLVECDGSVAAEYSSIQRAVQRLLTETCTKHSWGIPFQQITVHQAAV